MESVLNKGLTVPAISCIVLCPTGVAVRTVSLINIMFAEVEQSSVTWLQRGEAH